MATGADGAPVIDPMKQFTISPLFGDGSVSSFITPTNSTLWMALAIAAITLLPAFLGISGHRVNGIRKSKRAEINPAISPRWEAWGAHVSRHAWKYAIGVTALLLGMTAPVLALELGFPDNGNLAEERTERQAFDLTAEAFGEGFTGPLLIALDTAGDPTLIGQVAEAVQADENIAFVQPTPPTEGTDVTALFAFPVTSPQDVETYDTVQRIRADVFPSVLEGTDAVAHVGGQTAAFGDVGNQVSSRLPLFIASANIMNAGSISDRLLQFCIALVGRFRGGMGHVNVVASLIFSGMSGSAVADAAGIGKIIIDMMVKSGRYTRGYSAAITAATATIGPIIPPSIPMVLYALVSNASVGDLFLAGIVPGLVMGLVLMVMNTIISHRRGFGQEEPVPLRELPALTVRATPALLMPVILLGCIYSGVTTPTEAAAIAALYALVVAAGLYRAIKIKTLYSIFVESARSAASVGLVIGASMILTYIVIQENVPQAISAMFAGADINPIVFMLLVNLLVLLLGCILDATVIILVIVPLFIPTCRELGIDLVHFGVLIVVNSMIGLITPPYGILLFVINAVTGIPLKEIIREIWAFLAILLAALLLMILVPDIVLWLPRLFGYQG